MTRAAWESPPDSAFSGPALNLRNQTGQLAGPPFSSPPAARPLWPRVAGRGQNPHQGGQQQGPETQNSLNKFIRAADQRLDDYLRRLDEGDVEEGGTGGGART